MQKEIETIKDKINWKAYFIFLSILIIYAIVINLIIKYTYSKLFILGVVGSFWTLFMAMIIYALFLNKYKQNGTTRPTDTTTESSGQSESNQSITESS
jgi:hypothetical protein